MTIQGHPRSMIFVAFERACATSYYSDQYRSIRYDL